MKLTDISRQLASAFAAVGVSSLVLVGCNNSSAPEATAEPVTEGAATETTETSATNDIDPEHSKIVIGTTEGDFADMVRNQVKSSLEAQGYEVELVTFTDYLGRLQQLGAVLMREELVEALTTRETSFNRDTHPFEEFRRLILPALADTIGRRRESCNPTPIARIWSAGCSTALSSASSISASLMKKWMMVLR